MTTDEVIDLLTLMASFDRRTVGEADVAAWYLAVGDLPSGDAQEAVLEHYRESREWIMPADVSARVGAVRAGRLRITPVPEAPPEIADDPEAFRQWLREGAQAIASGREPPRTIGAGHE